MSIPQHERAQTYKRRAIAGVKWTTLSTAISTGFYLVQSIVLARLLGPRDFGLMAMAGVVISVAVAYVDMGLSSAIIQRQHCTANELSSLYWLNLLAGLGVFLVVCAIAPLIAMVYHETRLTHIVQLSALTFILGPLGQQYQLLLQKELLFRPIAAIDVASKGVGAMTAIASAAGGLGVYSLVLGQLAASGSASLLLFIRGHGIYRPRLHFAWNDVRSYMKFGLFQMGERGINTLHDNLDKLLIGFWLGAEALGYYNFAWNLALMPVSRINPILTRTAFPLFSRLQDDNAMLRKGYLKLLRVISVVNFPLFFGLCAVAPLAVPLVFGAKWLPAVPLVQVLSLVGVLYCTGNPVGSLLLAKGRADLGFWWQVGAFVLQAAAIALSAWKGTLLTVALTLLGLQIVLFAASYHFLIRPLVGKCWREYLASVVPSLCCSLIMVCAVKALFYALPNASEHGVVVLCLMVAAGGGVYMVSAFVIQRELLRELLGMAWQKRGRRVSSPPASPAVAAAGRDI